MTKINNSNRIANVKRNIFFGIIQAFTSQFIPFITRTIIIYNFGVKYIGLNSLFSSLLGVLSLMELGFGSAIVYSLYRPVSQNDIKQICEYLSYYRKIYQIIGLVILTVGLMIMPFLNKLVSDPSLPGNLNIYKCYLIFLADTVIGYLLYGYKTAIPIAYQRRDILSCVNIIMSLIKCVVQALILLRFSNFYIYLFSIPLITIFRNLIISWVVKRMYPDLKCDGTISPKNKQILFRKVYGILINKLSNISRNSIDSLCITAFIGLAATGIYNNYYFLMSGIINISGMICNAMMPSVGNSIVSETTGKNYADMRIFDFLYMLIANWATVCLLCMYQPFIIVWLGKEYLLEFPVALGLCAYFYVLKSGDIRWIYHEGAGLWYEGRFIMIGEAIANIVLNILLCRFMGVLGIVLATILSVFVTNCILSPELIFRSYFKNGKLKEYWLDHLFYAVTMILTAMASWFLCEKFCPLNMADRSNLGSCFICLGGRLFLCTILSCLFFWVIWHQTNIYKNSFCWIKKMVKE